MPHYPHLFEKGKIAGMTVSNRIVFPAMNSGLGSIHGEVTPALIAYYRERALGGAGVMITEIACIDAPRGRAGLTQLRIDHPRYISGLMQLAETLKSGGGLAVVQLHHAGRQTTLNSTDGMSPLAPSPIACRLCRTDPSPATAEEIQEIISKFTTSAVLAAASGFDGVELHAAHGYLLSQFISPYTNKRDDAYGGGTENRVRIVTDIIQRIKKLRPKLIVGVRFNMQEFLPGGIEPEEGLKVAALLEQAGADYLSVSVGMYETGHTTIEPVSFEEGWRLHLTRMVKEKAGVPVFGGGVIRHPDFAEKVLAEGGADYLFVGRNQIADPYWVEKARKGQAEMIRPCLSCNNCIGQSMKGLPIACTVNPDAARETRLTLPVQAAGLQAKIVVAGGGPAGMEAAAVLAQAGHAVTLIEKSGSLGGMLDAAAAPPHKQRVAELRDYLIRCVSCSGADIRLNTPFTADLLAAEKPDLVIGATGSRPTELPASLIGGAAVQAVDLLEGQTQIHNKDVLVIGGGITGCETALFLTSFGNRVTVIEMTGMLAADMENMSRLDLMQAMKKAGIQTLTKTSLVSIEGKNAFLKNSQDEEICISADAVVQAVGFAACDPVSEVCRLADVPVLIVGDAAAPRSIECALYEARLAAQRVKYLL